MALAFCLSAHFAHAGAYEQVVCDNEPDPALCLTIQNWYLNARTNENGGCCGLGDGYWTDEINQVTEEGLYVTITDPRACKGPAPSWDEEIGGYPEDTEKLAGCIRKPDLNGKVLWIPKDRIDRKRQGNPTGHIVTFINAGSGSRSSIFGPDGKEYPAVYCFFPGVGG